MQGIDRHGSVGAAVRTAVGTAVRAAVGTAVRAAATVVMTKEAATTTGPAAVVMAEEAATAAGSPATVVAPATTAAGSPATVVAPATTAAGSPATVVAPEAAATAGPAAAVVAPAATAAGPTAGAASLGRARPESQGRAQSCHAEKRSTKCPHGSPRFVAKRTWVNTPFHSKGILRPTCHFNLGRSPGLVSITVTSRYPGRTACTTPGIRPEAQNPAD